MKPALPYARLVLLAAFCAILPLAAQAKTDGNNAAPQNVSFEVTAAAPNFQNLHLSDKDAATYRKIFAAQRRGDRKAIDKLAGQLGDKSLLNWARVKRTTNDLWLAPSVGITPRVYRSPVARDAGADERAKNVALTVSLLLRTDDLKSALPLVRRTSHAGMIDRVETAQLYGQIAAAQLYAGNPRAAIGLAHLALQIAGPIVPEAAWIAGLSSWTIGNYAQSAQYFAWVPRSAYAGAWLRSAASFWTARALMRDGHYGQVSAWLNEAAKQPHSFYGLISTRALGAKFDFNWTVPPFSDRHRATLAKYPGAVRAVKLTQIGQTDMARIELALLDDKAAPECREAMAALSTAALKPDLAMQVAALLEHPTEGSVDTALYPLAPWQPKDGYRLDPALINAFIRQESRFKPAAMNKTSGATGLLQIMPRTARGVDKTTTNDQLINPETSLTLGQKYLEELLDRTNGNLFEAAIAYNAGPGNLASWKQRFAGVDDPLLFIELIPFGETRGYVERVMANYWIYSLRMGVGVASLDAVAAGQPARYARATNRDSTQLVLGANR